MAFSSAVLVALVATLLLVEQSGAYVIFFRSCLTDYHCKRDETCFKTFLGNFCRPITGDIEDSRAAEGESCAVQRCAAGLICRRGRKICEAPPQPREPEPEPETEPTLAPSAAPAPEPTLAPPAAPEPTPPPARLPGEGEDCSDRPCAPGLVCVSRGFGTVNTCTRLQ